MAGPGPLRPAAAFTLESEQVIRRDPGEVFGFFSDPANLEELTPPWLRFRIVGCSTPRIEEGTTIDYRLRVRGVPIRWRSRIREWDPPRGFVDEQVKGPYRVWIHRHTFRPTEAGVVVGDRVDYDVHCAALVHGLFVRPDLERIFAYRRERLAALFPGAVSGASLAD